MAKSLKNNLVKTRVLDCAALMMARGLELVKLRKVAPLDTVWWFDNTGGRAQKLITDFQRGKAECNLAAYLYARIALKRLSAVQNAPQVNGNGQKMEVAMGTHYWWVGSDKIAYSATYTNKPPHTDRLAAGNFFPTKADAIRASIKV